MPGESGQNIMAGPKDLYQFAVEQDPRFGDIPRSLFYGFAYEVVPWAKSIPGMEEQGRRALELIETTKESERIQSKEGKISTPKIAKEGVVHAARQVVAGAAGVGSNLLRGVEAFEGALYPGYEDALKSLEESRQHLIELQQRAKERGIISKTEEPQGVGDAIKELWSKRIDEFIDKHLGGDKTAQELFKGSFAFEAVPSAIGSIGAFAGAAIANPIAGAALMFGSETGDAYNRIIRKQSEQGQVDLNDALLRSAIYGVLSGTIEYTTGGGRIARLIKGKKLGLLKEMVEEIQRLRGMRSAILEAGKHGVTESGVGALQEASQQALQDYLVGDPITPEDVLMAGGSGGVGQGFLGALIGVGKYLKRGATESKIQAEVDKAGDALVSAIKSADNIGEIHTLSQSLDVQFTYEVLSPEKQKEVRDAVEQRWGELAEQAGIKPADITAEEFVERLRNFTSAEQLLQFTRAPENRLALLRLAEEDKQRVREFAKTKLEELRRKALPAPGEAGWTGQTKSIDKALSFEEMADLVKSTASKDDLVYVTTDDQFTLSYIYLTPEQQAALSKLITEKSQLLEQELTQEGILDRIKSAQTREELDAITNDPDVKQRFKTFPRRDKEEIERAIQRQLNEITASSASITSSREQPATQVGEGAGVEEQASLEQPPLPSFEARLQVETERTTAPQADLEARKSKVSTVVSTIREAIGTDQPPAWIKVVDVPDWTEQGKPVTVAVTPGQHGRPNVILNIPGIQDPEVAKREIRRGVLAVAMQSGEVESAWRILWNAMRQTDPIANALLEGRQPGEEDVEAAFRSLPKRQRTKYIRQVVQAASRVLKSAGLQSIGAKLRNEIEDSDHAMRLAADLHQAFALESQPLPDNVVTKLSESRVEASIHTGFNRFIGQPEQAYIPDDLSHVYGGLEHINPSNLPALVRLAEIMSANMKLMGRYVRKFKSKKAPKAVGLTLEGAKADFIVLLHRFAFKDPRTIAAVLAHEIGHALSVPLLKIASGYDSERSYIKSFLGDGKNALRSMTSVLDRIVAEHYQEAYELSKWWRPFDESKADKKYLEYRQNNSEIIADLFSMLAVAPKALAEKSPEIYRATLELVAKNKKAHDALIKFWVLLNGGSEAMAADIATRILSGFKRSAENLVTIIDLNEKAKHGMGGWWMAFMQEYVSAGYPLERSVDRARKEGITVTSRDDPYWNWMRGLLVNNKTFVVVNELFNNVVKPLKTVGIDLDTFGYYLTLSRIIGDKDKWQMYQAARDEYGEEIFAKLIEVSRSYNQRLKKAEFTEILVPEKGKEALKKLEEWLHKKAFELDADADIIRHLAIWELYATHRGDKANVAGLYPDTADKLMKRLLENYDDETAKTLKDAADNLRQILYEQVEGSIDDGIISPKHRDVIKRNKAYYVPFRPEKYVGLRMPVGVKPSQGSIDYIENPFVTAVLKIARLVRAREYNAAKAGVVNWFLRDDVQNLFPDTVIDIGEPRAGLGVPEKAKDPPPGYEPIIVMTQGKRHYYLVDQSVARAFHVYAPQDLGILLKALRFIFRNGIHQILVEYNPGFVFFRNTPKDVSRSLRNLTALKAKKRQFIKHYFSLLPESARLIYKGQLGERLRKAIEVGAANVPMFTRVSFEETDPAADVFARFMEQHGMLESHRTTPEKVARVALWLPRMLIRNIGMVHEVNSKVAGFYTLNEVYNDPGYAALYSRNYVGTPDFFQRGLHITTANQIFAYANVAIQGIYRDARLGTTPRTAGGFVWGWLETGGLVAILQGMAIAGLFGDDLKRWFEHLPTYLKHKVIIPLGKKLGGSWDYYSVGIRIYLDPITEIINWAAIDGVVHAIESRPPTKEDAQNFMEQILNLFPGVTPVLEWGLGVMTYLSGGNWVDWFTGREVVSPQAQKARPITEKPAFKDMVTWSLNKFGVLRYFGIRLGPGWEHTWWQRIPGVGSITFVTEAGLHENVTKGKKLLEAQTAAYSGQLNANAQYLLKYYNTLKNLGSSRRTPKQNRIYFQLSLWYDRYSRFIDKARREAAKTGEWIPETDDFVTSIKEMNAWSDVMAEKVKAMLEEPGPVGEIEYPEAKPTPEEAQKQRRRAELMQKFAPRIFRP